jgi:hypothetical protein
MPSAWRSLGRFHQAFDFIHSANGAYLCDHSLIRSVLGACRSDSLPVYSNRAHVFGKSRGIRLGKKLRCDQVSPSGSG